MSTEPAGVDRGLMEWVLEEARRCGASASEVLMISGSSLTTGVRLGEVEKLKSAQERRLGVRLFRERSSASASTSALDRGSLKSFIAQIVELAGKTAPDQWAGLPDRELHPQVLPELDLYDRESPSLSVQESLELARRTEHAAMGQDSRIVNSEGASFEHDTAEVGFANSQGFCNSYRVSSFALSVAVVAGEGDSMQRDYWYSAGRHFAELDPPEEIGQKAARRALRRLGARKVPTARVPIVFDPQMAAGLVRTIAGAVCGPALYRNASFLVGKQGEPIASDNVSLIDDATIARAPGSRPFDGEGVTARRNEIIKRGVLNSYLLDSYSARRLHGSSTGSAARGLGEAPTAGPSNVYLEPGPYEPAEIIRSVERGFYVTELIGFGINLVSGDYSRGAVGLWIERGELAYPVQEVTIAGNLKAMLKSIEMVGTDLNIMRSPASAPTIKISEMTVAGL